MRGLLQGNWREIQNNQNKKRQFLIVFYVSATAIRLVPEHWQAKIVLWKREYQWKDLAAAKEVVKPADNKPVMSKLLNQVLDRT